MNSPSHALAAVGIAATALLAGCGGAGDAAGSGSRVVASFYPLEYVAARVAGDAADVEGLTTPGGEPHDLELTVRQTAEVSEADVLVFLRGFQPAVDEAVDQAGAEHVVDAAEVADLPGPGGDTDPHFWTDPTRMATLAGEVEGALSAADPDDAEVFRRNLSRLEEDLAALDAEIRQGLADCARDTLVVSHDAFGYFGDRYGLEMHAINGLSPDAEPSPARLREVAALAEREGVTTVFSETLASPELAETLAAEAGLETAVLDPVEGLTDDTAGEDYLSLMRANLAAIQKANDCS